MFLVGNARRTWERGAKLDLGRAGHPPKWPAKLATRKEGLHDDVVTAKPMYAYFSSEFFETIPLENKHLCQYPNGTWLWYFRTLLSTLYQHVEVYLYQLPRITNSYKLIHNLGKTVWCGTDWQNAYLKMYRLVL